VCKNNSETYSVGIITGATSYVWTAPAGATVSGGQGTNTVSITYGASAASGIVSVYGTNAGGNGAASNLSVAVNTVPQNPATPDGPAQVNLQNSSTSDYSTSPGADSYIWMISPASAGIIEGTSSLATVTWSPGFIGMAEITVKGMNACGESGPSGVKSTQVLNTTGIDDNSASIRVISSESNGYITIEMNTVANQANVMLLDLSGRVLIKTKIPGQGTQQLSQPVKPGVYIIVVDAGSSILKKKILVI